MSIATKIVIGTIVALTFIVLLLFATGFKLQSTSGWYVYNATNTTYTISVIKSSSKFTYCSQGTFTINPGEAIYITNYTNQTINVYSGNVFVAGLPYYTNRISVIGNVTTYKKPSSITNVTLSDCTPPDYVTIITKPLNSLPILTTNITFGYVCNSLTGGFSKAIPNNSTYTIFPTPCTTGIAVVSSIAVYSCVL